MTSPALSITEHIYNALRGELISCRIRPGERLRTNELAKRFNVSLGAVREALVRLVGDDLAVADPRRGFSAAPISSADLRQLTEATIALETLCIEASLRAADARWEHDLQAAYQAVITTPPGDAEHPNRVSPAFSVAHQHFHDTLIAGCLNVWLLRMRHSLAAQAERYRQICLPMEPAQNHSSGYAEILAVALQRDSAQAAALVATRFRANAERFVQILELAGTATQFWAHQVAAR